MDDAVFERERAAFLKYTRGRKPQADTRPFIVKYRPETLDGVVGHEPVLTRLRAFVRLKQLPNLLFEGPPGVGKTTCGTCLANEMLGREGRMHGFLWLNASDDRTAAFVTTVLKEFVTKVLVLPAGAKRIVFLDEVDSMTRDAQLRLKRLMDAASGAATFILACNALAKVEETVQARCAHFHFGAVAASAVERELRRVAALERVALADSGVAAIMMRTAGDMRVALNALQTCADAALSTSCADGDDDGGGGEADEGWRKGAASAPVPLDAAAVCRLCDVPDVAAIQVLVGLCARGDAFAAVAAADGLLDAGHSVHDVLQTLHDVLRPEPAVPSPLLPAVRYKAFAHVSEALARGKQGTVAGNESTATVHVYTAVQLRSCVARMCAATAPYLPGTVTSAQLPQLPRSAAVQKK